VTPLQRRRGARWGDRACRARASLAFGGCSPAANRGGSRQKGGEDNKTVLLARTVSSGNEIGAACGRLLSGACNQRRQPRMIHAGILRRIRGRTGSLWPSVSGSCRLRASGGRLRSSAPQFAALPILHARTRDPAQDPGAHRLALAERIGFLSAARLGRPAPVFRSAIRGTSHPSCPNTGSCTCRGGPQGLASPSRGVFGGVEICRLAGGRDLRESVLGKKPHRAAGTGCGRGRRGCLEFRMSCSEAGPRG